MASASTQRPIAIVTGAGGGIGRAIVRQLVDDGFHVVATDLDGGRIAELAAAESPNSPVEWTALDVCDEAACEALVARLPAVNALVNNAGVFEIREMEELTAAEFRRLHEINALPAFILSRLAARKMPRGSGRIVNMASRAYLGARHYVHYVSSKAAVVGITRALAMELAEKDIMVNAIAPGAIDTPMLDAWGQEKRAGLAAQQPLGRLGAPEDIAYAVSFLVSPRNRYISGQVLLVDGGKSLGGIS